MKYELKDKVLHQRLDRLSDGDFSKRLNELTLDGCSPDFTFRVRFGGQVGTCFRYSAVFRVDEIMIQEGYDPNAWNSYPEVTPPEGVRMRVEKKGNNGRTIRDCAVYKNGHWIYDSAYPEKVVNPCWWMSDVDRFRPWN